MMKKLGYALPGALVLVGSLFVASPLSAGKYVIYIHGRGSSTTNCGVTNTDQYGKFNDTDSYGAANKSRAVTSGAWQSRFVNYDGASDPRTYGTCRAQTYLQSAMTSFCTGGNQCVIMCHSAGCMATDYAFSQGAGSGKAILWVVDAASASGGSELANVGFWVTDPMTVSLRTGNARSFNHNMNPVTLYMVGGYNSPVGPNVILPGNDDGAVSFHSTCGYASTGNMTNCADGNNAKYTARSTYCNSRGALTCNTSLKGYNAQHGRMKCVGRDAVDRLLGYL